jgi:GNAT superfamily N-acetyltransferase
MAMDLRETRGDYASETFNARWYEDRDRDAFIQLYGEVFWPRGEAWFDWKYVDIPYADHVPIIVAEKDGEVGGFRPVLPLPIRIGDRTVTALQLVDLMVHPDHRRKGVMTVLSEWMKFECSGQVAATFTYANEAARRGFMKMNNDVWTDHDLGPFVKYERLQTPGALVPAETSATVHLGARVANPLWRVKNWLHDALASRNESVVVTREDTVDIELLAKLYESAPPAKPHVYRDEEFYAWRFAEPEREFVQFTAHLDGEAVAAVVVGLDNATTGPTTACLTEVLPLAAGPELDDVFSALLTRVTDAFPHVDHISATNGTMPHRVLATHGFSRSDSRMLSKFTHPSFFLVCPMTGPNNDDPELEAALIPDTGWHMTYCDRLLG